MKELELKSNSSDRPGGYSYAILDAKKRARRNDASERQAKYDSLTVNERIARAKTRRGESKKELAWLTKQLNVVPVASKVTEPVPVTPKPKKAYQRVKRS
jgi:hypothetical protein